MSADPCPDAAYQLSILAKFSYAKFEITVLRTSYWVARRLWETSLGRYTTNTNSSCVLSGTHPCRTAPGVIGYFLDPDILRGVTEATTCPTSCLWGSMMRLGKKGHGVGARHLDMLRATNTSFA